jgi:hypothetical protein
MVLFAPVLDNTWVQNKGLRRGTLGASLGRLFISAGAVSERKDGHVPLMRSYITLAPVLDHPRCKSLFILFPV